MDPGPGHTRAMGRGVAQVGAAGLGLALASALLPAAGAGGAPAPPIRVSVVLPVHHVVAGRLLKATVVLRNTTTKPIIVQQCAIDGWLAVGLTGKVDSYPFGHEAVGCGATVKIKPGANRFPIHITTSYAACTGASPAGNRPNAISPNCVLEAGRQSPPPLPAGSYTTKVDIVGLDGLTGPAPPVRVRISAPAHPPPLPPCAETPTSAPALETVPNVVGLGVFLATVALGNTCLQTGYADPVGKTVVSQSPAAGSRVAEYSTVGVTTK